MSLFFVRFLSLFLCAAGTIYALQLSRGEAEIIGQKIYQNECGSNADKLVWWNSGEAFASLGIGHFIWYPEGKRGPFEETFPSLLAFIEEEGISPPEWLKSSSSCPWTSKEDFSLHKHSEKQRELQQFLLRTVSSQAAFIGKRFDLEKLLSHIPAEKKEGAAKRVQRLLKTMEGKYALLDYLNFKGEGILPSERYNSQGWGLVQVLEEMADSEDPQAAFSEAAKQVLVRRVKNAPQERKEERWLPGWTARVSTYRKS